LETLDATLALAICASGFAAAQTTTTPALAPKLSGISFLVGSWGGGAGKVPETGETSRGSSIVSAEAGGAALLRRDHTDLFGADGKASGSFDQI
jgi:hypothetical protein